MVELLVLAVLLVGAGSAFYVHNRKKLRRVAVQRMKKPDPVDLEGEEVEELEEPMYVGPTPLRRWYWIPILAGILIGALSYFAFGVLWVFAMLIGLIVAVLGAQAETFESTRRTLLIETQLADAIDIIVGALRSGVGLVDALEHAVREAKKPVLPILSDMSARLRLGDNPAEVFGELAFRVPLETFRLFSFTLAVHWEIGGSLAPTLATVGRTIRDRIDLSRRVRSQTMQARASVIAILFITYVLGFIVWRTAPDRMEAFISTQIGQGLMAACIFMQLVGLVWMQKLSDIKY